MILFQEAQAHTTAFDAIMQAFNKGLFDFLIATDDPSKEGTDKSGPSPIDSSTAATAPARQQPEATGEAAEEAAGTPGADNDVEDAAPDHAWTEAAAVTAKSIEVTYRQAIGSWAVCSVAVT